MQSDHRISSDDVLLHWLGSIARRADQLARLAATREGDRRIWMRAEFEFFERIESAAPLGRIHSIVTGAEQPAVFSPCSVENDARHPGECCDQVTAA
jgi:hypothetical protein